MSLLRPARVSGLWRELVARLIVGRRRVFQTSVRSKGFRAWVRRSGTRPRRASIPDLQAEGVGFEPTRPEGLRALQARALDQTMRPLHGGAGGSRRRGDQATRMRWPSLLPASCRPFRMQRRGWDSNPRWGEAPQRFSRPPRSSTPAPLLVRCPIPAGPRVPPARARAAPRRNAPAESALLRQVPRTPLSHDG